MQFFSLSKIAFASLNHNQMLFVHNLCIMKASLSDLIGGIQSHIYLYYISQVNWMKKTASFWALKDPTKK
jgi:hypothetical protein